MNREIFSSPQFIIPVTLIVGILVVVGGFFPFCYYSVNYTHYYITEMPTTQQKQVICDTDMFKVISVTNVSSYCCDEYYDLKVSWHHANIWNYAERENKINDYLKSIGLQITENCN